MRSSWAAADQQEEARDPCGWCIEPGPLPGAPLTSCLPVGTHGCGLVLRTAEPQQSLLGRLGKPGGRPEEDERWAGFSHPGSLRPGPGLLLPRIAGTWATCAPGPVSLPLSLPVPWVTFSVPSCLHLSLYRLFSVSVLCSARVSPRVHFSFPSSALPPAALSQVTKSYMSQKRKKEKKSKHKKAKQKQTSSVAKRGVPPVARRPPPPVCVCPARLPACPPADDMQFSAWVFGDGY